MRSHRDLRLAEPLPWATLLAYMAPRLVPGIERVDAESFERRTDRGVVRVKMHASATKLRIGLPRAANADRVAARVAALFALDEDRRAALAHLGAFPELALRIARTPGMRPLGAWSPFELCVRTVLGQQVTVAAAGTLMHRLVQRCGSLSPRAVLAADLSNMGMPGKRVETLRALAQAVVERRVVFGGAWPSTDAALRTVPGFGPWTRSYLAIRLGREADAFPESDVGLIRAAGVGSPAELLARAEAWRPYRSLAAIHLWAA